MASRPAPTCGVQVATVGAELCHPPGHPPADYVPGGQVACAVGAVQVLAVRVPQPGPGPPQGLRGQGPRVATKVHPGRVELHELEVGARPIRATTIRGRDRDPRCCFPTTVRSSEPHASSMVRGAGNPASANTSTRIGRGGTGASTGLAPIDPSGSSMVRGSSSTARSVSHRTTIPSGSPRPVVGPRRSCCSGASAVSKRSTDDRDPVSPR